MRIRSTGEGQSRKKLYGEMFKKLDTKEESIEKLKITGKRKANV
jgi:hypothetical protein